jgi:preprotein translocase subunit SecB
MQTPVKKVAIKAAADTGKTKALGSKKRAPVKAVEIVKIYLKESWFEQPNSPAIFANTSPSSLNLAITTFALKDQDAIYEVSVKATVTSSKDQQIEYLAEVEQAGLFKLHIADAAKIDLALAVTCPNTLYPDLMKQIDDLIRRGGYKKIQVGQFDFLKIHKQKLAKGSK